MFLESKLEMRSINHTSAAMYVRYGYSDIEIKAAGLERIVPVRKFTRGRAPGITSNEAKHTEAERAKDKWVFLDLEPTELEKRKLMAAVLEIGVQAAWGNSVFQVSGKYYLQQKGGPTAREVNLFNQWDEATKKFIMIDANDTSALSKYCYGELRKCLESLNPDLKYVMELESDFNGKLPTLDTRIWLHRPECKAPEYEFYSKDVSSKYCILEKSALDYSQKINILSNDLVRRLFNTKETISQSRKDEIVDEFSLKLLRSGYSIPSSRQILISGIRCFQRKVYHAKESGVPLHRSAQSTLGSRLTRK